MKIKRIILSIVVSLLLLSTVALAKTSEHKLQLFFQPAIMDDITGDVLTGINLKNVDLAIPQDKGSICGLNFDFEYDDNVFNVLTNNNGEVVIITDENTLIKDSSKIHATVENGVIHISYNDDKDLIKYDGTLCRFILIANNVNALWNSFDYYPIRFVEDSISVNTYNEITEPCYNIEGIDGKVGAYIARKEFDILDEDILNAIIWHTTGRPDMSLLEKIIFVADYIEPSRRPIPELNLIRQLAFTDINQAVIKILENTLKYLNEKGNPIDDMTQKTYDSYIRTERED